MDELIWLRLGQIYENLIIGELHRHKIIKYNIYSADLNCPQLTDPAKDPSGEPGGGDFRLDHRDIRDFWNRSKNHCQQGWGEDIPPVYQELYHVDQNRPVQWIYQVSLVNALSSDTDL